MINNKINKKTLLTYSLNWAIEHHIWEDLNAAQDDNQ